MGCCDSCALTASAPPAEDAHLCIEEVSWHPSAPASLQPSPRSSLVHSLLDPLSPRLEDATARTIVELVDALEERRNWKVHTEDPVCLIKSLPGKGLRSNIPVFSVEVRLSGSISPEQVLCMLYSPPARLRWDREMLLMEEREVGVNVWLVYSVTKLPFPFKSRDFSERRVLVQDTETAVVVQYSVGPDQGGWELTSRFERAEEYFSLARVERMQDMTRVQITSQCDLKLPVTLAQVAPQAALKMQSWAYQLHKQLSSACPNSRPAYIHMEM